MRSVLSWGWPLYAAILTVIIVIKGLTDNNLKAEGDVHRSSSSANVATPALTPECATPSRANGNQGSYPIPAPLAQPKHLFHVIIRYEGDGLPDQSMLATALGGGQNQDNGAKKSGKSKVAEARAPNLFQFIIRYEGDGIVDDNVAKLFKDYFSSVPNEKATCCPAPTQETQKATSATSEQYGKTLPTPAPAPQPTAPAPQPTAPAPQPPAPAPRAPTR